jgi:VanZ family protein
MRVYSADLHSLQDHLDSLQQSLGGDQVMHLLAGAGVMVAGFLIFYPRSNGQLPRVLFTSVLGFLALDEFSQILIASRQFSLMDLGSSFAGALLVYLLYLIGAILRPES